MDGLPPGRSALLAPPPQPSPPEVANLDPISFDSGIPERLTALRRFKPQRRAIGVLLLVSDVMAAVIAVILAGIIRQGYIDPQVIFAALGCALPIYVLASLQTGAHNPAIAHRAGESIAAAGAAFLITAALFFFGLYAAKIGDTVSRLQVGIALTICAVLGAAGRYLISLRSQRLLGQSPYSDLCLYDGVPIDHKSGHGAFRAADVGLVPDLSQPEMVRRLGELVRGMDRIVVHCPAERRDQWSRALRCVDVRSEIVLPELSHLMPLGVRHRSGQVSLVLANGPLRWHKRWTKMLFDYAFATVAVILAGPLMIMIAILIRLEDGGSIFFHQDRIGLGNRPFKIWKFRTMRVQASDHLGAVSTSRNDQRVTRVGRILRSTSLDELPQLFNVLAGQMSIVGPRPHAPASRAEERLFWVIDQRYWHRHSVRPGITGLAQVRGLRGATERRIDLEQRLYADLEYVATWSLLNDIKIIFRTFSVLLHRNAF
jgi:lipopolysaccharide/colanic/teichoic acid biosynthesis glycosyltransferase